MMLKLCYFFLRHFVDPVTGEHTNGIESGWSRMKADMPKRIRTHEWMVLYMYNFLYRDNAKQTGVSTDTIRRRLMILLA